MFDENENENEIENENENNVSFQKNEENLMNNKQDEEDHLNDNVQKNNINKENNFENYNFEEQNKNLNNPNHPSKKIKGNQKKYAVKSVKKKYSHGAYEEKKGKNNNDGNISTEELFKKALGKNLNKGIPLIELDNEGNTLSTKVTEVLYDKFVGQNIQKSKHLDIYSKIKDEEIKQGREATKTKNDAKKINGMIVRQEDYEKLKSDKKKERQKEIKNKLNKEYFIPNGKKNVSSSVRSPNDFFNEQKKFIEKKQEIIHKMTQDKMEREAKNANVALLSKNSEKMANSKKQNETQEDFCKRLAGEKLKTIREVIEPKREEKKLTQKEVDDLTEKLHNEKITFRNNREKKEQEQIEKMKNLEKNDFVLQKSKKVLFDKFISSYEKILLDLFNQKDNFEINYEEYKTILNNLGFIKTNSPTIENLVKESFYFLQPKEEKIDTYALLTFGLAALGIYKGNDEKKEEHSSKVTVLKKEEEKMEENKRINKEKRNINISNNNFKRNQNKTSYELIKSYLPQLDLDKYGYSGKECKLIKNKFLPFVSGISEAWSKDLMKKKQDRLDKIKEENKKNNLEESKKLEYKLKKEEEIINSFRNKILKKELIQDQNDNNENANTAKSFKVEDMYEILQKKKQREIDNLKAKQEEDIQQQCTFQPNSKTKPVNKKEVAKNIEKLYFEGKEFYIKKLQQEEKDLDLNSENEKNCTFKPVIKDYKGNYFENNPLKEDKQYNIGIKKMEKIREEKGYTNKEIEKPMAFDIEPKSNKEDIHKRVIPNRAEKIVENVKNEYEEFNNFDDQGNQNILKIEVKLENNKKDLLVIHPGDDYIKIVDSFCNKNNFNEEKRIRLIRVVKDRMRKNDN